VSKFLGVAPGFSRATDKGDAAPADERSDWECGAREGVEDERLRDAAAAALGIMMFGSGRPAFEKH
jgi:hypothetical protein